MGYRNSYKLQVLVDCRDSHPLDSRENCLIASIFPSKRFSSDRHSGRFITTQLTSRLQAIICQSNCFKWLKKAVEHHQVTFSQILHDVVYSFVFLKYIIILSL